MQILNWKIEPDLKKEIDSHYRTDFAISLKDSNPVEIIKKITFDNVAPNITIIDVKKFFKYINKNFLDKKIKGVGLEVGAGPGFFSAVLADNKKVEKIYAVEVCENIVTELMPVIADFVLGKKKSEKVVGVVGEFNNLELKDNSVDFVFDFFSLHHSNDLQKTLSEIHRVLKPGGVIFCFDKARADYLKEDDLKNMLDKEYSEEAKKNMGVDVKERLTRRMNGEQEFRLKDWKKYFMLTNFSNFEHYNIARSDSNNFFVRILKNIFSKLPPKIQIFFTAKFIDPDKKTYNNLSSENRVYTKLVNNFPKEISLIIGTK
jgi:ubiquinone/menaquinone biosynthesis C-methylase UbiE